MRAFFKLLAVMLVCAQGAWAQDLTALARVDPEKSTISDGWFGKTTLRLSLTQGVPFRVFTLADPARLVVDFREVDWSGIKKETLLPEPGGITDLRFGAFRPGWSRLVADLAKPMLPVEVGMPISEASGAANLEITLETVEMDAFLKQAGSAPDRLWQAALAPPALPKVTTSDRFTVVLDPGHGGIDPGAERDGVAEKDLMLSFARTLQEALRRAGLEAILTREDDRFVALEHRVAIAHQVEADLFISLHADSLSQGGAKGATVYTLSDEASDAATAHLAARHNRADIIAGVDLTGSDDQVAGVLLDLARQETEPRSAALAQALAEGMATAGGPMNRRPLRRAGFSVLKSADVPSVLVEVGFLSSKRDLANLRDPIWRAVMANGMADAILKWRDQDAALAPLVRQ
ncbi:MAG: N-acetylmuramoyl-L-alanine amidase [Sulfitobacter sp.]|nr:N-acetylmuramoyl-L-alanine amidase [Sulfitobacter sp.]